MGNRLPCVFFKYYIIFSDSSPVRNLQSFGAEEPVYSTRRVTRSQQQPTPVTPKKYPLRQTRSSGSETEQVVDFSDRGEWVRHDLDPFQRGGAQFLPKEGLELLQIDAQYSQNFCYVHAVCLIPFLYLAEDSLVLEYSCGQ